MVTTPRWAPRVRPCESNHPFERKIEMISLPTILLVILVLLLLGALPTWPHSRSWGYYPSGGLGLIAMIVVVLLVMERI
jgi:hypothetical protein